MIAQAYTVLGHLAARHSEVLRYLRSENPVRLSDWPHEHPSGGPCLWCALSPVAMPGLEANLLEVQMTHLGVDRDAQFPSRAKAESRIKSAAPNEASLRQMFGPYWFDVLALPLELVHAVPERRRAMLAKTGQTPLQLGIGDDRRMTMVWLAESTLLSLMRRRGGLPLGNGPSRTRVMCLAHHLWARSKGLLVDTGQFDLADRDVAVPFVPDLVAV